LRTTARSPRGKLDATTAACLVFLDPLDDLERTASLANLVFPEHLVSLAALHWRSARKCPHHPASRAHQDHLDPLVHLANLAHLAPTETQAALARMVATDHQAHQAPTAHLVNPARTERRDPLVHPLFLSNQPLAMLDPQARMDHQAQLGKMALQFPMVDQAPQETRDHLALQAHPAMTEPQETKAHQAPMAPRESRVFAPNIAPPMVVSSSKMEQGDKRSQTPLHRFCYTDEKPVIFMSIVVLFIFFTQPPQLSKSTVLNTAAASPVISFGAL